MSEMSTKTRQSQSGKLPVHIVEQHNDVVPFIHRAIASKQLPFSGIPIIHLDSHPDLLIPIHLDADNVFKPHELYASLSIENWLLPLVYAKHIDHVTWVKPPWANQIKASQQTFVVGKCCNSGKLRLSSKDNYFLTDGLFRVPKDLENCAQCKLTVVELRPPKWRELDPGYTAPAKTDVEKRDRNDDSCPLKSTNEKSSSATSDEASPTTPVVNCTTSTTTTTPPKCVSGGDENEIDIGVFSDPDRWSSYLHGATVAKPYVLDVDLDFFSTQNPFQDVFQSEKDLVHKVFKCPTMTGLSDEEVEEFTKSRQKQLQNLEDFFYALDDKWLEGDTMPDVSLEDISHMTLEDLTDLDSEQLNLFDHEMKKELLGLCHDVLPTMKKREITFAQIYDFGCTLDDTDLPHHISSQIQIEALVSCFRSVLERLPKPAIVTISRSSHDDYCPKDQVDRIESMVLKVVGDLHGCLDISKNFDDDDDDNGNGE